MKTEPLVSVITICFNSEKTIRRTIESVVNQSYREIEYIVVDGGSTDGTLNIIKAYEKQIVKIIPGPDNGIGDAFNKGIAASTGEFIQFINADDTLHQDKIRKSIDAFARHPDAAFVYGDIIKVTESGEEERIPGDPLYERSISFVMNRVNHPTMLVRHSLFDRFGLFDLRWKVAMDYDWILRLHRAGFRGVYSSDIIVRTEAGGISDAQRFRAFRECRDISIRHGKNIVFAYGYYLLRIVKHLALIMMGRR